MQGDGGSLTPPRPVSMVAGLTSEVKLFQNATVRFLCFVLGGRVWGGGEPNQLVHPITQINTHQPHPYTPTNPPQTTINRINNN